MDGTSPIFTPAITIPTGGITIGDLNLTSNNSGENRFVFIGMKI